MAPLSIEDVAGFPNDAVESGIAFAFRFEYHLFNGDVYDFIPGRAKDENTKKYFLKARLKNEGKAEIVSNTRNLINQWVYEIPEWKYGRFIDNPDDLLQKGPE